MISTASTALATAAQVPRYIVPMLPSSIQPPIPPAAVSSAMYLAITNVIYLKRRSYLRDMSALELWKIRSSREPNVSTRLYFVTLLAWQAFVIIFPIIESISRCIGKVSFFYSYPNAGGVGVIFEPRDIQHVMHKKRAKHQIRLDWHRFSLNVGGIGRDGYRHPPSVVRNLPHIDIPQRGLKHWPWRRRWKTDKS